MTGALLILRTLSAVLALVAVGWLARRHGLVSGDGARSMGRFVADVAFPALCFKGLAGIAPQALLAGWIVPVLGFVTLGVAAVVGGGLAPLVCAEPRSRSTFAFSVAMCNWIFFPLPIAEALYGEAGVRIVILNNAGAQVFLWTIGVWMIGRGERRASVLKSALLNPGLLATVLGLAVALTFPAGARLPVLADAVGMLAAITVPLAAVTIGAQLGERPEAGAPRVPTRSILGLAATRLVVAPAVVVVGLLVLARLVPATVPRTTFAVEALIAAMPVSLTTGALVEKARGDVALSSRGIVVTSVLSIFTVPALEVLLQRLAP